MFFYLGGGFFAKKGKQWILQGIISSAILNGMGCDATSFAVYTNINAFTLWIKNTIDNDNSDSHKNINLDNAFEYNEIDDVTMLVLDLYFICSFT